MATKNIRITQTSDIISDGSIYSVNYLLEELDESDVVLDSTTGNVQVPSNSTVDNVNIILDAVAREYALRDNWTTLINAQKDTPRELVVDIGAPDA